MRRICTNHLPEKPPPPPVLYPEREADGRVQWGALRERKDCVGKILLLLVGDLLLLRLSHLKGLGESEVHLESKPPRTEHPRRVHPNLTSALVISAHHQPQVRLRKRHVHPLPPRPHPPPRPLHQEVKHLIMRRSKTCERVRLVASKVKVTKQMLERSMESR